MTCSSVLRKKKQRTKRSSSVTRHSHSLAARLWVGMPQRELPHEAVRLLFRIACLVTGLSRRVCALV